MPELETKDISERMETVVTRLEELHGTKQRDWISYFPIFTAMATLVIAILTVIVNYKLQDIKAQQETLQQQQHITEAKLVREQEGAAFSLSLLHEILGVIGEETNNQKKISAMSTLLYSLEEMYRQDEEKAPLRLYVIKLVELLPATNAIAGFAQDTATIPVRTELATSGPTPPPPVPAAAPIPSVITPQPSGTLVSEGDPKGWDYDIFSCEEEPGSVPLAKMLFDALTGRLCHSFRISQEPWPLGQPVTWPGYGRGVLSFSPYSAGPERARAAP
jgi:hypothetical protein